MPVNGLVVAIGCAQEQEEVQTKPLRETITPLVQRQERLDDQEQVQTKCEAPQGEEQVQRSPNSVIARGRITEEPEGTKNAVFKTDDELKALREAEKAKTGNLTEFEAVDYKTSTTRGRGIKGDQLTGDHIPSRAALVAAEEARLGRKLTKTEAARIKDEGITVVLKGTTHAELSRTYGGRNVAAQIAEDAKDLSKAFGRDTEAILEGLYNDKKLTNEIVGAYLEAYRKNVRTGLFSYSSDIDEMLMDFLKRAKK